MNTVEVIPLLPDTLGMIEQVSLFNKTEPKQWKLQINGKNKSYELSPNSSKSISHTSKFSWSFQSSNEWHISSKSFFTIAYRPSYAALPSYTKINCCSKACSTLKQCCSKNTLGANKVIPFKTQSFYSEDVKQIEINDKEIYIEGVGPCNTCQVYFSLINYQEENDVEIDAFDEAEEELEIYRERSQFNRENIQQEEENGNLVEQLCNDEFSQDKHDMICVMFAIPKDSNE